MKTCVEKEASCVWFFMHACLLYFLANALVKKENRIKLKCCSLINFLAYTLCFGCLLDSPDLLRQLGVCRVEMIDLNELPVEIDPQMQNPDSSNLGEHVFCTQHNNPRGGAQSPNPMLTQNVATPVTGTVDRAEHSTDNGGQQEVQLCLEKKQRIRMRTQLMSQ